MKFTGYKIAPERKGRDYWTSPDAPKGYQIARTCGNCAKCSMTDSGSPGVSPAKYICQEVTEHVFVYDTGVPGLYSREPFYTSLDATCDEHKFERELKEAPILEPIDDKSNLCLVVIVDGVICCKVHGAMICNHVTDTHRFYRCYSTYGPHPDDRSLPLEQRRSIDRTCEAACKVPIGGKDS